MNVIPEDPVTNRIYSGWNDSVRAKDFKSSAKWLRLMVSHVKTPEGVPSEYQPRIREWVDYLISELGSMGVGEADSAVRAIDYATKQFSTINSFGSGLKGKLTPDERKQIRRTFRPLKLRTRDTQP